LKLKFFIFRVAVGLGALPLADGHITLEVGPVGMGQSENKFYKIGYST
jgi:hypothetical protein